MLNQKLLGAVSSPPAEYVEDVFSTYLYKGNGATGQSIVNDIDLAGEGGMVWVKARDGAVRHAVFDTERSSSGTGRYLVTDTTDPEETTYDTDFGGFNNDGFSFSTSVFYGALNSSSYNYSSWTFRKSPKFFDVVTYTGNGTAGRTVSHNLGSVPGMMIIKRTSGDPIEWVVYHRSLDATSPQNYYLRLNTTAARALQSGNFNNTAPTSSDFTLGNGGAVNTNGETYVAYLFAHDAGGFGTSGTDNVISCGSFDWGGEGDPTEVNLGFEPQFVLLKNTASATNWTIIDNMRGWHKGNSPTLTSSGFNSQLLANTSGAETSPNDSYLTSTGFAHYGTSGTVVYMAIRRPMKPPTSGTEVFSPIISSASVNTKLTTGFPVDSQWGALRNGDSDNFQVIDRLRKISTNSTENNGSYLRTSVTNAENAVATSRSNFWDNTGFKMFSAWEGGNTLFYNFARRPKFFDTVCYTGTGTGAPERNHNLTVAPEFIITKKRNGTGAWAIYAAPLGNGKYLGFAGNGEASSSTIWDSTTPTSTQFFVGNNTISNASGTTYVAYLFATCAGVSKVGSYTGTGSTQTINCGFTGGARYVMIQRTDTDGYNFYVWDTVRGMISGTDPKLAFNDGLLGVGEINENWVYTATTGFQIVTSDASVNASGGSYIYLAIA